MLHLLRVEARCQVVGLLTTVNEEAGRVAMHGVPEALLRAQAGALELPLWPVPLPWPCSNAEYEGRMGAVVARARGEGIEAIAFGDLFLEDIRAYRENRLAGTGIAPLFPLWGSDTRELALRMIGAGVRAVLSCIDAAKLPREFAGRTFDARLLAELPQGVDPCGEHGEFHTFVWDGPGFRAPLRFGLGAAVAREGFVFRELLPPEGAAP